MCDTFSAGGYTDWYLPAIWELNECYNAAKIVNTILGATNGFQYFYYWISTEYTSSASNSACGQGFDWGYAGNPTKASTSYRVRAVRKF